MAHALTTVEMLKAELSIPPTTPPGRGASAINAASDAVRRYCGRDFVRLRQLNTLRAEGRQVARIAITDCVCGSSSHRRPRDRPR